MFKSFIKTKTIEFLCDENDYGVIPEPFPARKFIPDWFKALPMKLKEGLESSTIKRCNPFMDAMSIGWIIPLAADIEIVSNSDASGIEYKWSFYKNMIENHTMEQVHTNKKPNPNFPKPPMKFINHWLIKVPDDYSLLFMPPLNRQNPRFTCFSGLVDCDKYLELVSLPFVWNQPDFRGILPQGTPLVQVVPIKRDTILKGGKSRVISEKESKELGKLRRRRLAHESIYRDELWEKK